MYDISHPLPRCYESTLIVPFMLSQIEPQLLNTKMKLHKVKCQQLSVLRCRPGRTISPVQYLTLVIYAKIQLEHLPLLYTGICTIHWLPEYTTYSTSQLEANA
jgi:hypothetical protein